MKLLIIANRIYSKGGIQRYTRYQYTALQQIYGNNSVFLAVLQGKEKNNCFEEDINVHYSAGGISFLKKIKFLLKILIMIKKKNINLLIINHRALAPLGFISQKLFNINYYTNVYGLEIWSGMNKFEQFALLNSSKLIGDCKFILDYIYENYKYKRENMYLLYDPVDTVRFKPDKKNIELMNKYNIPKDKLIISTIGRLDRNKGHEIIIKSLKYLNDGIIYLIVGDGDYHSKFKDLAKTEEVSDRVFFTGRVHENELVDLYNIADIVGLLSHFGKNEGEGLPLGLIEASACSKPIICGCEDGSKEAVSTSKINGFVINPRNVEQFIECVKYYFEDRTKLIDHGLNGREFVIDYFEYSIFTKNLLGIIKDDNQS